MTEKEYKIIQNFASTIECLTAALKESHEENRRIVKVCNDIWSVTAKPDEATWKDNMQYIKDLVAPYMPF